MPKKVFRIADLRASEPIISLAILMCFAIGLVTIFTAVALLSHGNFGTSAYDLGIFDQAFWRYSRLLGDFNTVRGLPILGDHFSPIAFIFAPLYRIYPSVFWPIAMQALSVAVGGIVLYYIVLAYLPGSYWVALGLALSYFLHPAVHSTLLWQYHELVLASGMYMGLIWCYLKERWWPFALMLILLLSCREDMPFTLVAFGCLALIEKRWRYGILSIAMSVMWWILVVNWLMPLINGLGYFRATQGTLAPLFANLFNLQFYLARLCDPKSLSYLWQVFFPFGFLALLSPRFMLPALPTLVANILIGAYNTEIGRHYTVSVMPFLFWGAVVSVSRFRLRVDNNGRATMLRAGALALAVIAASAWSYSRYSALNLRYLPDQLRDWQNNAAKREFLARLANKFPQQGISASDYLLPHLSHREQIYLFPNPWMIHYWGIAGENPAHPNAVSLIVITPDIYVQYVDLVDYLLDEGFFRRVQDEQGVLVLQRIKDEARTRVQAIAEFKSYLATSRLPFAEVALSPIYSTTAAEFRRVDVSLSDLQALTPPNWQRISPPNPSLLNIDLAQGLVKDWSTRYVRAVVNVKDNTQATLALGSDDGVTVWLNGAQIHENIVFRMARPWDDHVKISLNAGENVLVFRVNNGGGAWRLLAKVQPDPTR